MTLESIKEAISALPDSERNSLLTWLTEHDSRAWDRQIESDFTEGGVGMSLLAKWDEEIDSADFEPLGKVFGEERK